MSLPRRITRKCSVCGEESTQTIMASTNTLGGTPDLDLRPAEMMRSTMGWWIQECPHCGYVSDRLDDEPGVTREWLKSESFTSCGGKTFPSKLATRFYKHYLINVEEKNENDAFYAALHAAWACDDRDDAEMAIHCRMCALAELEKIAAAQKLPEDTIVLKADLLRRTGQFDTLMAEHTGMSFTNKILDKIVAFQIEKAKQQDTRCYRLADVPGIE